MPTILKVFIIYANYINKLKITFDLLFLRGQKPNHHSMRQIILVSSLQTEVIEDTSHNQCPAEAAICNYSGSSHTVHANDFGSQLFVFQPIVFSSSWNMLFTRRLLMELLGR